MIRAACRSSLRSGARRRTLVRHRSPNLQVVTRLALVSGTMDQHLFLTSCLNAILMRFKSTTASALQVEEDSTVDAATLRSSNAEQQQQRAQVRHGIPEAEMQRLRHIRNVGIFAHVDAGKTTVTERMLALAGIVTRAGNVDDGDTVTDYLPAERERGITIQSAAIRFPWAFHNAEAGEVHANDAVSIALIDTPGHVDFSVEVNRSVAVLDGAVLVVDAAAGVQAQTETVWRAMTRPSLNNHQNRSDGEEMLGADPQSQQALRKHKQQQDHAHEPLPCVAVINKMDKMGSDFHSAVQSLRDKLPGANPIPIQLPIFRVAAREKGSSELSGLVVPESSGAVHSEDFVGVLDLVHMRAILWPNCTSRDVGMVEHCIPAVVPLWTTEAPHQLLWDPQTCPVSRAAVEGRLELVEALAEVDQMIEEMYLNEQEPTNAEIRRALRRATLCQRALPVLAAAAVDGKGVEPCLDAIADFLPSPLDRLPPAVTRVCNNDQLPAPKIAASNTSTAAQIGHCLSEPLLALAFKVVHLKGGRGGGGDGRVVFARIYSGCLRSRDAIQVISPPAPGSGSTASSLRSEKVGGMLEMAGGRFDNLEQGEAKSGDVCALVGLKTVVTGDTIMLAHKSSSKQQRQQRRSNQVEACFCAGVASPKPVLTVRLEAESATEQDRLGDALLKYSIEDPSLVVEETDSYTLLSGLGELHIEITLDRLHREHALRVRVGAPSVSYRETLNEAAETDGLVQYDRTVGDTRFEASVHIRLEPLLSSEEGGSSCQVLVDPVITVSDTVLQFMGLEHETDDTETSGTSSRLDELEIKSEAMRALLDGCRGALKRGPVGGFAMSNLRCHVVDVTAEGGFASINAMPGSLRAAAAQVVQTLLQQEEEENDTVVLLEPRMSLELSMPNHTVGAVLSDLSSRRGTIGDVFLGDEADRVERKALVRGEVPLVEILGYAKTLRSMTGGEASFTSEYKGHAPCSSPIP